jgi:hypothetical protein
VTIRRGANGNDVRALQLHLVAHGFPVGVVDGDFGPRTETVVRAFQRSRGLTDDGIVGPRTWDELLKPPSAMRPAFPHSRCWPLRCLRDGRKPQVTSGHFTRNPSRPKHNGVDLFYPYRGSDPAMRVGDGGRTSRWWIPPETYACAVWSGRVVAAGDTPTGKRVWLEHMQTRWLAGYFHLDRLDVVLGQLVTIGDSIGRVSDNPKVSDPIHLHFELYLGALGTYPRGTVDPESMLAIAPYLAAV